MKAKIMKTKEKNFADRLKEMRVKRKLSQMKLGELTDIHYTQIGRYERGESTPSLEILKKMAEILEVSVDYLLEGDSEDAAKSHIYDKELLHQFKQVQDLDEHHKYVVKTFLDAFLMKCQIQRMVK